MGVDILNDITTVVFYPLITKAWSDCELIVGKILRPK